MQRPEERLNLIFYATGGTQDAKLAPESGCSSSSSSQRVTSADEIAPQGTTEADVRGKSIHPRGGFL